MQGLDRQKWQVARQAALDRDRDCTASRWDHLRCLGDLDVHHISDDPDLAYDLDNLTVLCDRHHALLHHLQRENERRLAA